MLVFWEMFRSKHWRRVHRAQGGTCPPLLQMAGHGRGAHHE